MAEHKAFVRSAGNAYVADCVCGWTSVTHYSRGNAAISAELHERQDESWDGMDE